MFYSMSERECQKWNGQLQGAFLLNYSETVGMREGEGKGEV